MLESKSRADYYEPAANLVTTSGQRTHHRIAGATVDDIVPAIVTFGMRLGKDVLVLSKIRLLVYPCSSLSIHVNACCWLQPLTSKLTNAYWQFFLCSRSSSVYSATTISRKCIWWRITVTRNHRVSQRERHFSVHVVPQVNGGSRQGDREKLKL